MARIVVDAERNIKESEFAERRKQRRSRLSIAETICEATAHAADDLELRGIALFTESGSTARKLSKYHPSAPIFALSPIEITVNRLNLLWGTTPIRCPKVNSNEAMVECAERLLEQNQYVRSRDPGGDGLAAFLCDPEHYREGLSLDDELPGDGIVARRLAGGALTSQDVVAVSSSRRRRLIGSGWSAVGDAAISFDPLSGYGLTNALSSAIALADAVAGDSMAAYSAALERRFSAYLEQRAEFYALEPRWRERPFWARR